MSGEKESKPLLWYIYQVNGAQLGGGYRVASGERVRKWRDGESVVVPTCVGNQAMCPCVRSAKELRARAKSQLTIGRGEQCRSWASSEACQ